MGLTRFALVRPLAMLMVILGIVLMGIVAFTRLPVDRLPNISIPFVNVSVSYPGASPEDVEQLVMLPLEDALSGVPGTFQLRANAREGSGNVTVQLVEGTDLDKAFNEVQRRVAGIRNQLPRDAGEPRVAKFDPNATPILNLAITGPDLAETLTYAQDVLQPKLLTVPGVADANLSGGLNREIQVRVDPAKLAGYGITVDQINTALQRENLSAPAGQLDRGTSSLSVRSLGLFEKADDLNNMVVATGKDGAPIYLRNLATVKDTYRNQTRYLRLDGQDAVGLSIIKQADANTLLVADQVTAAIESLRPSLPRDSRVEIISDNARFVKRSLDAVQFDLGLAVGLTAIVLLVFLHSWRNTAIVILAIPTSLLATFLVMFALGFSINLMTLMALAMTIGILVDDSIVVLENIHRHLGLGESPFQAALNGRSEIGLAAIAITFTDMVVYLPVAFMQGNVGQLFRQYGLTIVVATLFSLLVSFTLTPMLASKWLSAKDGHEVFTGNLWMRFCGWFEARFESLAQRYGRSLHTAIRFRWIVFGLSLVLMVGSVMPIAFGWLSTEYAPQEDDGQFRLSLTLPVGSSLDVVDEGARTMEKLLTRVPEIISVYAQVGGGGQGGGGGGGNVDFTIETVEKSHRSRTLDQIMAEVRTLAASGVPDARARTQVQNPLSGGANNIAIDLLGDDVATLQQVAAQVIEVAETVPGIPSAQSSVQQQQTELRFAIDRDRAAAAGVSTSQISSALRTIVQGTTVTQLRPPGQSAVDILVVGENASAVTTAQLSAIPIVSRTGQVTLGQVTQIRQGRAPTQIQRVDRKRAVQVSAAVAGRPVGDVAKDLRVKLETLTLPPNYRYEVRGSVQQLNATLAALSAALALSVLLVYMTLVALYENFLYPLAIMFALPLSAVGAFSALMLTGNTINIFSMIGLIALMGLVEKNGILLVDYANTLRSRGQTRMDALANAGSTRLRPIVMTSATVVAAMAPLTLKFEAGAESRAPMAVVIVGGVVSSTILTLYVVPVIYSLLDDLQERFNIKGTFRWPWNRKAEAEGAAVGMPAPAHGAPMGAPAAGTSASAATTLHSAADPDAGS